MNRTPRIGRLNRWRTFGHVIRLAAITADADSLDGTGLPVADEDVGLAVRVSRHEVGCPREEGDEPPSPADGGRSTPAFPSSPVLLTLTLSVHPAARAGRSRARRRARGDAGA